MASRPRRAGWYTAPMSSSFSSQQIMVRQSGLVPVASSDVRSTPLTVEGEAIDLGLILQVTTAGTGTISSIMVETAVSDASAGDSTQWITCPNSEVLDFSLAALNTVRIRIADPILDKVRVRMTGDAAVSGATVRACWISNSEIS